MAKALSEMSAAELQKAYDRTSDRSLALSREMIEAGRGQERPSETRTKSDELSLRVNAEAVRFQAVVDEMRARERYHGSLKPIRRRWI